MGFDLPTGATLGSLVKEKNWNTQEIVIGGWRQGDGGRSGSVGALLMGIPGEGAWTSSDGWALGSPTKNSRCSSARLRRCRASGHLSTSGCGADAKNVTFVRPTLVGEVRYGEWTSDGRLRQPSWRGLRPDKKPESQLGVKEV